MGTIVALILLFNTYGLLAAQSDDQLLFVEGAIQVERIEEEEHKTGATTVPGYNINSALPKSVAIAVHKLTGIECDDASASVRLMDEKKSFRVLRFSAPGFGAKGESRIGKKVLIPKHDYEYSFKQIFQVSNADSFIAEGAYEFNNKLKNTRVYAVCRIRAKRKLDGSFSGTSEWIGPIDMSKPDSSKLSAIFADLKPANK